MGTSYTLAGLIAIQQERIAQNKKWGEQNHDLVSPYPGKSQPFYEKQATRYQELNDKLADFGLLGWDTILLEEVFEALSATDPEEQEKELIQVAAVALAAYESSKRNRS